ncbi:MAG: sugar ABC transporter permease [Chloroflexi bacterium]|nr:sugar ABC transporter permease [Chloroflexota bacterium]
MRIAGKELRTSTAEAVSGYLYISPWLIGFVLFTFGPFIASFLLSFADYAIATPPRWAGLGNFRRAFLQDDLFWKSLRVTATYVVWMVPTGITISLLLAVLLNQPIRGNAFFRTLFFLPTLTPTVAAALLWKWMLHPEVGLVNSLLWGLRIRGPGWLSDPDWALPSIIIIGLWGSVGGGRMIIFLAALQGVPQELYEAAEIDGAGGLHKFLNVTLPMITPSIFFNLVIGIIGAFSTFAVAYVGTDGGPMYATWFYMLHLVRQAMQYFQMGYASSLAWILFIILVFFTFLQLRLSQRWVYYAGGK